MKGARILIVDDERGIIDALARDLRPFSIKEGITLSTASTAIEALGLLEDAGGCAVVLSDLMMPGMRGNEFLKIVADRYPDTVNIVLTGNADISDIQDFLDSGVFSYHGKPWDKGRLILDVKRAVQVHELRRGERAYRELMEKELAIAREFHDRLFARKLPVDPRLRFDLATESAGKMGFGGDFAEIRKIDDDRYLVIVADVAGHGLKASFMMALMKALMDADLKPLFEKGSFSPSPIARWINRRMCLYLPGLDSLFVSTLIMEIDLAANRLRWVNAGQPPFVVDSGDGLRFASTPQLPICVDIDTPYEEEECPFPPGSRLVIGTDGLFPTGIADPEFDRLSYLAVTGSTLASTGGAASLMGALSARLELKELEDDMTILLAQRRES